MDKFVARQNIDHYRDALVRETDDARRHTLAELLAEERAKLAATLHKQKDQKETARDT